MRWTALDIFAFAVAATAFGALGGIFVALPLGIAGNLLPDAIKPPLVAITMVAFGYGLIAHELRWRRRKLRRENHQCVHCGYDLTANTTGICPECGRPIGPGS